MTQYERVAVVAGGSAGVGRAVADQLKSRGYQVSVLARGEDRLNTMKAEGFDTHVCDVRDAAAMETVARRIAQTKGRPSVWVNCAMTTVFGSFMDLSDEEFRSVTDTTYFGQVNGTRAALSVMDRGSIVCVGSGLAYRAVPFQSAYCGAKHAINGFSQAVRCEMIRQDRDIHIGLVQLPAINTPQFDWARNKLPNMPQPAPPIFQPELAADGVMKCIDQKAREIFVGESVLELFFGNAVFPDLLDKKLAKDGGDMQMRDGVPEPGNRPDNLDQPVAYESTARGSFSERARENTVIVDADMARKVVFLGGAVALLGLGLLTRGLTRSAPRKVARSSTPWGLTDDSAATYDRWGSTHDGRYG